MAIRLAGRRRVYRCIATLLEMDDPNAYEEALVSLYGEETLDMATDLIDGELRFFGLQSPGPCNRFGSGGRWI